MDNLKNRYVALRHGESKANVAEIIVSGIEDGIKEEFTLTKNGEIKVVDSIREAKSQGLLNNAVVIYSSPFSRCRKTAEIAKEVLETKKEIIIDNRLQERWFGALDKTHITNYQKVWEADKESKKPLEGEESVESVWQRTVSLIEDLERDHSGKTFLLVSHGDVLQILQAFFDEVSASNHRTMSPLEKAEVRELISPSKNNMEQKVPPKDSVIINVCIIPSDEVGKKSVELSQSLKSDGTAFVLDGVSKFAHMTVFMARFANDKVGDVVSAVEKALQGVSNFSCEHTGYFMTAGRYFEISYRKSKEFVELHEVLINALKDYRINPGDPFEEGYFAPYNEEQQKNAQETGYDLAHDLYRPHITLTRYKEGRVPEKLPKFPSTELSFNLGKICAYKADDNGAVYEKLADFDIQRLKKS